MTGYLIRRAGQSIAVVIGVMILTFILLHMEPGSVARSVLGLRATPARVAIFDNLYGLNKPLYQQFAIYVKQLFQGNLGISYQLQQPVSTLIAQRLPRDAILLGLSTLLALVIGVPTGIYQAARHNRLADDLLAAGLAATEGDAIRLTAQGQALRGGILAASAEIAGPMLASLDRVDLETTIRTLQEITRQARAIPARPAAAEENR